MRFLTLKQHRHLAIFGERCTKRISSKSKSLGTCCRTHGNGKGRRQIHCKALCDYPEYDANLDNDFFLVKDLRNLFDEADVLIAHNGDRFDIRKAQARMIRYEMQPPSRYQTIDTLKAARKHFQFDSSRLDASASIFGLGRKLPTTGFNLWKRTMAGDRKAWAIMKRYNKHDVALLEKVYEELRPWMTTHPNLELFHRPHVGVVCPNCQSSNTVKKGILVQQSPQIRATQLPQIVAIGSRGS